MYAKQKKKKCNPNTLKPMYLVPALLHVVFVGQKSRQQERWRLTLLNPAVIRWHILWNVCYQLLRFPEPLKPLGTMSVWGFSADRRQTWVERFQNNDRRTCPASSSTALTAPSLMKVWHSLPTLPRDRDIFFRKSSPRSIITFLHCERSCEKGRNSSHHHNYVDHTMTEEKQKCQLCIIAP